MQGVASELDSGLAGVAEILGDALRLEASGAWTAGGPVQVAGAQVESDNFSLGFEGSVDAERVEGDLTIEVRELAPFSVLAGRQLAGAAALSASGSAALSGLSFTFALNGEAENLDVGVAPLTGLLQGRSTITGTVARSGAELRLEALRIENSQMALHADGGLNGAASQIDATLEIADVAALTEAASGGVTGVATIAGALDVARVEAATPWRGSRRGWPAVHRRIGQLYRHDRGCRCRREPRTCRSSRRRAG